MKITVGRWPDRRWYWCWFRGRVRYVVFIAAGPFWLEWER